MSFYFWYPFIRYAFPKYVAGEFIQRIDLPDMFWIIFDWSNIAVKAVARFVFRAGSDRGGHKNFVAPNNWARMTETGNLPFPKRAFRLRYVPLYWSGSAFNAPTRTWSTKLRPVLSLNGDANQQQNEDR